MKRIASRLGDNTTTIAINNDNTLEDRKLLLEEHFREDIHKLIEETVPIDMPPFIDVNTLQPTGTPNDIYYYHPNHLGNTAFITDNNATITQGFLYAPFGEITTEYNINFGNNVIPKYSFNAKELDEETGMYYYEARYYEPPVFTSRDPMMDQKPWLTPYHYCSNNPVGRMDPSGCEDWIPPTDGSGNWTAERGDGYWKLAKQAGIPLEEARADVVTANQKRGQKRTTETMVYPGDVVHIGGSNTETTSETNRPSISGYPLIPASGRIEPVSLLGTLFDDIIGGLLQDGLISLGMDEQNASQLSSGIVLIGSILVSKRACSSSSASRINNVLKNASKGNGFYGLGEASAYEANIAGAKWVGKGYRVSSDGKAWISSDGLRQYRLPSYKKNLNKTQANFESRGKNSGKWENNGHLDIRK